MTDIMNPTRTEPQAARGTPDRRRPKAALDRRLLVVEDDEHFADLLLRLLERNGYTVDLAANGTDALIAGLENAYDAILLDVMMPGPDGFDVVRRLREGLRDVPILMVTARDSVEDRVRGLRSGADDYLVKPFPMADLLARLRAHLQPATAPGPHVLRAGDISLDPITGQVRRAGPLVHLRGSWRVSAGRAGCCPQTTVRSRGRTGATAYAGWTRTPAPGLLLGATARSPGLLPWAGTPRGSPQWVASVRVTSGWMESVPRSLPVRTIRSAHTAQRTHTPARSADPLLAPLPQPGTSPLVLGQRPALAPER